MRAFLHDACAFAVILTQYDQRAALDSRRRKVRKGVRGDIGADGGFPSHGTAQRVVDRSRQHRRSRGFTGRSLEVHAEFVEDVTGIREHIHQM